jgi:hypothetical protein
VYCVVVCKAQAEEFMLCRGCWTRSDVQRCTVREISPKLEGGLQAVLEAARLLALRLMVFTCNWF